MKKGQLAIFVIAALAVVFLFVFVFYLRSSLTETQSTTTTRKTIESSYEITPVHNYVSECVESTLEKALFERLGFQGGYINATGEDQYNETGAPQTFLHQGYYVPYYLFSDVNTSPTFDEMETRLTIYVAVTLESCLDFSVFNQFNVTRPEADYAGEDFNFANRSTKFEVQFNKEDISVDVEYPLQVERTGVSVVDSIFGGKANVRFSALYATAENVTKDLLVLDVDRVYDLTANCSGILRCPSDDVSHVFIKNESEAPNYVLAVNDTKGYELWFAIEDRSITGSCSC